MRYPYTTYDVFTRERYAGNQLAIVSGAEALAPAAMQQLAREFNISETVFVLAPRTTVATARVRIFTPRGELPFAGHPTVGAAVFLAETRRRAAGGAAEEQLILLEEEIGPVRVGVKLRPGEPTFAEFAIPKLPEALAPPPSDELLALALGVEPRDIGFENHRPSRFSAGVPFTFVPVSGLDTMGRIAAAPRQWTVAFGASGQAYVYCRQTIHVPNQFHARMLTSDLREDPATGSAAAAFAGVIQRFDLPTNGVHAVRIEQGYEMGRPSEIQLEMSFVGSQLRSVRVGGHAVKVAEGFLEV